MSGQGLGRWLAACLGVLALASVSAAQSMVCPGVPKGIDPVAFETITVSTAVIGLTASAITTNTAGAAFLSVEVQPLRYTLVGTPSATVGHLIEPPPTGNADGTRGAWICGRTALLGLRMIRTGAADATVRVTYYKLR